MVRWPRQLALPVVLALLTVLLGVLAALQYRWTSEISQADVERRHAQLARSAYNFSAALDHELGRIYLAFRLEPGPSPAERASEYLDRLAAWRRTSDHPALVDSLLLASRGSSGPPLLRSCGGDPARCAPVDWPSDLPALLQRLAPPGEERQPRDAPLAHLPPILEEPLSLVLPSFSPPDEAPPGARAPRFGANGLVVVRLDTGELGEHVLPQLAEAAFGPLETGEYAVAVLRGRDRAVLYSSDPEFGKDEIDHSDLRLRLLGPPAGRPGALGLPPGRPELRDGRFEPGRVARGGERFEAWRRQSELTGPAPREGPWLLVVRHRGGSLDEAVASVRRRNLAVGLGVLGLLGAAAFVLATGAQRARRLARQQLEFVAGVTHELHTPLAAIRSAGQNLADGIVTEPDRVRRYGDLIQKEGGRLTTLVAQVLDFAGIESGTSAYAPEPLPLAPLVERVVSDLALVFEESGMTVETDVSYELPPVRADAAALGRVLENLITNAVKFAAEGQWIGVSARAGKGGASVLLQVEDRGPGIPPGERARVFEPFYRGRTAQDRQAPGSGLGLSVVRHVVETHGGRVRVEPREGGGTRVVVELKT
jgi:two-component system, OmpR family, sensor histidine kinase SenX3